MDPLNSGNFNSTSPLGMRRPDRMGDSASAASRQKSCNACVRGKRRCDKRSPRCTRCAAKGLDCVYQRQPPPAPSVSAAGSTPEMLDVPEFDMSFDMDSLGTGTGTGTDTSPESMQQECGGLPFTGPEMDFSVVDFMTGNGGATSSLGELWDLPGFGESKMDLPPIPIMPLAAQPQQPIRDLSLLQPEEQCLSTLDVLQVHDPRSRVGYIVNALTELHVNFSRSRTTPFMHPRIWMSQLPKTVLVAFTASSAYTNSTPQTKAWTMKVLMDAAKEIHREGERASSHTDKLARVQALIIVNLMRLFDGDMAMRAAAEREMSVLIDWVKELSSLRTELEGGLPSAAHMTRDQPPQTWESWILLESIRRTTLVTFAVVCLVHVLKSEDPPCDIWGEGLSFTASRHLWDAASSVEFFRAWRDKPQYCITDMGFKEFWMYGRPDDMDDFTRLMLTPQVGVDAIDHFMMGDAKIPV